MLLGKCQGLGHGSYIDLCCHSCSCSSSCWCFMTLDTVPWCILCDMLCDQTLRCQLRKQDMVCRLIIKKRKKNVDFFFPQMKPSMLTHTPRMIDKCHVLLITSWKCWSATINISEDVQACIWTWQVVEIARTRCTFASCLWYSLCLYVNLVYLVFIHSFMHHIHLSITIFLLLGTCIS